MTDIINELAGLDGTSDTGAELIALRERRADAVANAQLSFEALLEPDKPGTFTLAERYAIAAYVAGVTQAPAASTFYLDLLADEAPAALVDALRTAIAETLSETLETSGAQGPQWQSDFVVYAPDSALGRRLAAALDFAHLLTIHPKDASPKAIGHLDAAGWSTDDIVSLGQLISFLAFQLRVAHGLQVLAGDTPADAQPVQPQGDGAVLSTLVADPGWEVTANTLTPQVTPPAKFVNHPLGWKPWVPAMEKADFTDVHVDALIKPERIDMPYFRLLARDPAALKARTLTDLDIFYNTAGGMGRAERELAATVASRYNGCEYCASVHQGRAKEEGGDATIIDRLLDEGIGADLETPEWTAIRDAAVALTTTHIAFTGEHVAQLREVGFDDLSIIDAINSSAFFNWANRLMLTLGEPDVPKRYQ